jgi:putative Mg2+ transporter-C (MgtC) family protein
LPLSGFETEIPIDQIMFRLVAALLFGGAIGLEREIKDRPAGLRTNMLVSLAAASFMLLAIEMISAGAELADAVQIDPLRVTEAVIAGVAFLGAGAIMRSGHAIKGLTTGASLWVSGAIGLACGGGYLAIALPVTILALVVLYILHVLEVRLESNKRDDEDAATGKDPASKE